MLSVIIPIYNVDRYLERCINSIIMQSYYDLEVILIDDGSTDDSGQICDKYVQIDSRFIVYHQVNKGVSDARNKGLEMAQGEFIIFIDPDDWIAQDMFLTMMKDNTYDMVVCGIYKVTASNNESIDTQVAYVPWPEKNGDFITNDPYCDVLCKTGGVGNKIIHREIIGETRFAPKQTYGEDAVFLTKILRRMKEVKVIKKPLYYYFTNRPGNVVSAEINARSIESLVNARIIYDETKAQGKAVCGVSRIQLAVWDVFYKIPDMTCVQYKSYLNECIFTLRYPSIINLLLYVFDKRMSYFKFKKKVAYLLVAFFPSFMLRFMQKRR